MANSKYRMPFTLALLVVAGGLAFLGRLGLDWLIGMAPKWAGAIERFGGWALGMAIGLLVVLPVFRMYGVFNHQSRGLRGGGAEPADVAKGDDMTKRR